ncbi:MAG: hypothetical protein H6742_21050 [Alphaproteobacteria bacterium]|nr:hypothetical protein [Alphaproteobacteria bacterium]
MLTTALSLALVGIAPAHAAPLHLDAAELRKRDELLAVYDRVFLGADAAPEAVVDDTAWADEHGPLCLTGWIEDLQQHRDLFDDAEWRDLAITLHLPGGIDAPPIADGGDVTCVGDTAENSKDSEHFVVYYENADDGSKADQLLESLEYSWSKEIDELGWKAPLGTDDYKLRFLIENRNYAGAYTTVDFCGGVGYMPYMVTGRGSFQGGSWYKTMAAHEFNHSSQFGYGFAHEFFWWEATATWVEEHVYPDNNDWADMYWAFSEYPYIGLNASSQSDQDIFYHMYAMGIFGTYLDEYVGGHDLVQDTWELVDGDRGQYNMWLPDAVEEVGVDFDEAWAGFLATTAFMDFREARYFYDVKTDNKVSSLPGSGSSSNNAPQSLGVSFSKFSSSAGGAGKYLQVDFTGDSGVDWIAVLVTGSGNSVNEYATFDIAAGEGSAWIPFDGDADGFLVVSPKDEGAQGYNYNWGRPDEYEYSFEACLVDSETGVPCGSDPGDGGDGGGDGPATPGDDDGDEKLSGCGCTTPAAAPMGAVWALGLLGLVARRRRD